MLEKLINALLGKDTNAKKKPAPSKPKDPPKEKPVIKKQKSKLMK